MSQIYHATSYSAILNLRALACREHWSILSTHRHACNLSTADNGRAADNILLALVNEVHGNGPFHVVIPGCDFTTLGKSAQIKWQNGRLNIGHTIINFQMAIPWSPQLAPLDHKKTLDIFSSELAKIQHKSPLYSGAQPLVDRAQRGVTYLQRGILAQDRQLLSEGVTLLIGLGPGLTPAGDDFLMGLLAALTLFPRQNDAVDCLRLIIANIADSHTTRLSATWLYHATQGNFGEPWHNLNKALDKMDFAGIDNAFKRIAKAGATSGVDALYGFGTGCQIE